MSTQNLTSRDIQRFVRQASARVRKKAVESQRTAGALAHGQVINRVTNAKPRAPVDTGSYKFAWKFGNVAGGSMVWNESPQAGIIEFGVRPGRIPAPKMGKRGPVPFKALVEWAKRKFYGGKGWQKDVNRRHANSLIAARFQRSARTERSAAGQAMFDDTTRSAFAAMSAGGASHEISRYLRHARVAAFIPRTKKSRAQVTSGRRDSFAWAIAIAVQRRENQRGLPAHHIITDPRFVAEMRALSLRLFHEAVRGA